MLLLVLLPTLLVALVTPARKIFAALAVPIVLTSLDKIPLDDDDDDDDDNNDNDTPRAILLPDRLIFPRSQNNKMNAFYYDVIIFLTSCSTSLK